MRRAAGTPTLERGADPAPTKGRSSVGRQRPACARYRARPDARDPGEDVRVVVAEADDGAGAGVTAGNDARGESQDEGRRRLIAVRFQHDDGQGGGHA